MWTTFHRESPDIYFRLWLIPTTELKTCDISYLFRLLAMRFGYCLTVSCLFCFILYVILTGSYKRFQFRLDSPKRRGRSHTQATALEGASSQFSASPAPFKLTCLWMISSRKSGERLRQSLWPSRTLLFVVFSWSMTLWGGRRLGPLERNNMDTYTWNCTKQCLYSLGFN